jgi:two-component system sensor histidine kinase DctS
VRAIGFDPGRLKLAWRRRALWTALVVLVLSLLVTLVWLAGRYEASQVQSRLDRDAIDTVGDIRSALSRNLQSLQALQFKDPSPKAWRQDAATLLRDHREIIRVEWRVSLLPTSTFVDSPYRANVFERFGRDSSNSYVAQACTTAQRISAPAYSGSYYVPLSDGLGIEVMELCMPIVHTGRVTGFLVASYSLQDILEELVGQELARSQEISFTEGDGTRLAVRGTARRNNRVFTTQQLLDLPGAALVLRMDSWRGAPDLFPNVLTALVTAMSIALVSILVLLGKDMRRRLKAESDLADALAFRKAMEDSLITGLRARDLHGRITYVNPAFCQMVGFGAQELLGQSVNAPYWPPELAEEYRNRQAIRLAGTAPPREGFESVFMHKDGTRFPVLIIEAPLINAQGEQTGWMSAFLDIREQRRVEDLSRASQERLQATARLAMMGEMASLLSHELNQPLAAISSYATGSMNLLSQNSQIDPEIVLAVQRIAQQAERAGKVIKSVHDFIRRRDQSREAVSPQALMEAVLPLVNLQARKLGVLVQTRVESDLPDTFCDRTMVEQVLLNLARNAMQAMDETDSHQRKLLLQAQRIQEDGSRISFSVTDWGPGIAPEIGQQLFTPFFTTKKEGMGLGLSLCRTVIEQHGGTLTYHANLPRGTQFCFTLPVAHLPLSQLE